VRFTHLVLGVDGIWVFEEERADKTRLACVLGVGIAGAKLTFLGSTVDGEA
jgi:hypothetical protein